MSVHEDTDKDHRRLTGRDREGYDRHRSAGSSRWDDDKTRNERMHPSRRNLVEKDDHDRERVRDRRNESKDSRSTRHDDSGSRDGRGGRHNGNKSRRPRERSRSPNDFMTYEREEARVKQEHADSRSPSPVEKQVPNYEPSGALMGDKLYKGVSFKYAEPAESRKPDKSYRLYVFKNSDILDTLVLDQQPAYLFGRDRTVADVPLDHPSCSKQHAVLQYKLVTVEVGFFGEKQSHISPFIYDLGSANGTTVNGKRIKPREYVELKEKDVIEFGLSSREYLILSEDADK
ncbi:SMAD/FHA domain-containing protein [Lipomyces japonicus]|uniref:SMAD/FHA domain-containing protein n=1 Tax=Lipomyces japonicus TaxID=56871 RepID=UPI0034CF96B1